MTDENKTPLNKDEREWLAALRKRHGHLKNRILEKRAAGGPATTFDAKEAEAIEWALREIAKTRDITVAGTLAAARNENEITHRRKSS